MAEVSRGAGLGCGLVFGIVLALAVLVGLSVFLCGGCAVIGIGGGAAVMDGAAREMERQERERQAEPPAPVVPVEAPRP